MQRLPVRWQVVLSLLILACFTFFVSGKLVMSAFAQSMWWSGVRRADSHLRYVLSENLPRSEQGLDPFAAVRALDRPVELSSERDLRVKQILANLSGDSFRVLLYDSHNQLIPQCRAGVQAEQIPPQGVFDILKLRCVEHDRRYRHYRHHRERERKEQLKNNKVDSADEEQGQFDLARAFAESGKSELPPELRPKPSTEPIADNRNESERENANEWGYKHMHRGNFLRELFFGPVGICNIILPHDFHIRHDSWLSRTAVKLQILPDPLYSRRELSAEERERRVQVLAQDDDLIEVLDRSALDYQCPPRFMRVSYKLPGDLQCLVAPITRDGKILGYAQMIYSWADTQYLLREVRRQLTAIGLLIALIVAVLAYTMTGWCLRPLDKVVTAAAQITKGDLSVRTGLAPTRNELYTLGSNFDKMIDKLENAFTEQRRFIGDASHELKTPITSLCGVAEVLRILRNDLPSSQRLDKALTTMDNELERMTSLVKDLLMLSRTNEMSIALSIDPININELIDEALQASLANTLNRQIERERGADIWLLGDQTLLLRALRNIIDNAVRYTPEDKKISISHIKTDDNCVIIEVADQGCGIKAEHLQQLGKRFYRTDSGRARVSGGTGLGLAITMAVVERHQGKLTITSREGEGTQVKMRLPLPSKAQLTE